MCVSAAMSGSVRCVAVDHWVARSRSRRRWACYDPAAGASTSRSTASTVSEAQRTPRRRNPVHRIPSSGGRTHSPERPDPPHRRRRCFTHPRITCSTPSAPQRDQILRLRTVRILENWPRFVALGHFGRRHAHVARDGPHTSHMGIGACESVARGVGRRACRSDLVAVIVRSVRG